MLTLSVVSSLVVLGLWAHKTAGRVVLVPLFVVFVWAFIMLLEWHRLIGGAP
jgi:hypothetical protein